ncbi:hypothetical protein N7470_008194 [Penicillium chermesinum]|nr:hypothetical protein N7470_008194 [Penicillium chermesinum]
MAPTTCVNCKEARAVIIRPKNRQKICRACFLHIFETERVAIGASGGKDSTVLAAVLKTLNERYNYGLDLCLLSIDEGIRGYRDDSLETVKRNAVQYEMPLEILGYGELYGWTMDQVVAQIGKKGNCTYCGVFRRQALDRGAAKLGIKHVVTGHNADDVAETVMMNLLRGDLPRLSRGTSIVTDSGASDIKRSKPLKYAYEKEIVLYAHHRQLDYFTTECIYSPEASILDIVKSGEDMAALVPNQDSGKNGQAATAEDESAGGCGSANGRSSGGEMAAMEEQLASNEDAGSRETEIKLPKTAPKKAGKAGKPAIKTQTLQHCEKCGYMSSQAICKACMLLDGLNRNRPKTEINIGMEDEEGSSTLMRQMEKIQLTNS